MSSTGRPKLRHYGTKSRSGCITCRRRHVKCDEGKPSCDRCLSSLRQCEYPLTWNNDNAWITWEPGSRVRDTHHEAKTIATSIPASVKFKSDLNDPDKLVYWFKSLLPVWSCRFDYKYWCRSFLYGATAYPEIQYLISAIVTVTRSRMLEDGTLSTQRSSEDVRSSRIYYHKGLTAFQKRLATAPLKREASGVVLTCAALLVALNLLYGEWTAAACHFEGVISGLELAKPSVQASIDPEPVRLFKRLDLQVSMMHHWRRPRFATSDSSNLLSARHPRAEDLEDSARAWLDEVSMQILGFLRNTADEIRYGSTTSTTSTTTSTSTLPTLPTPPISEERLLKARFAAAWLESELRTWHTNFVSLVRDPQTSCQRGLRLMHHHCRILLATCLEQDETAYDRFLPTFKTIVADARALQFDIDSATILPVYFTALKCRHPETRAHALDILRDCGIMLNGKVGAARVFFSQVFAGVAELVVELERELLREWQQEQQEQEQEEVVAVRGAAALTRTGIKKGSEAGWWRIHQALIEEQRLPDGTVKVDLRLRYKPQGPDGPWAEICRKLAFEDDNAVCVLK